MSVENRISLIICLNANCNKTFSKLYTIGNFTVVQGLRPWCLDAMPDRGTKIPEATQHG